MAQGEPTRGWSTKLPHVRLVLRQVKDGKISTPEQLVDWDAKHGRRLFDWDDKAAAGQWRIQQARLFFNSFRPIIDGLRVRGIIGVPSDEEDEAGNRRIYMTAQAVSESATLRLRVIGDVTKRLEQLASELKMWKLSAKERAEIMQKVEAQLAG